MYGGRGGGNNNGSSADSINRRPSSSSLLGRAGGSSGNSMMGIGGARGSSGVLGGSNQNKNTPRGGAVSSAGTGRMAKYANPTLDGTYTASHHNTYRSSGWVKVSRLNRYLTEGDLVTVFSQFGEVVDVRFAVREFDGQPTGFAFLEYLNSISAVIACDALNSSPIGNIAAASAAAASNAAAANATSTNSLNSFGETAASSSSASSLPNAVVCRMGGGGVGAAAHSHQEEQQPFICRLLPTDAVGIEVDHCDAGEVPPLREGLEGYGHWFHKVCVVKV